MWSNNTFCDLLSIWIKKMPVILLTGGLGFIGSHTAVALSEQGYELVIVDNLSNASIGVFSRLKQLCPNPIHFYEADIRDEKKLTEIFAQYQIHSVIHFAGLKAVGESVAQPIRYYDNNVNGSLVLLSCLLKAGVKQIIFSSSATVYGTPASIPMTEESPVGGTTNPYGTSKYMVERILQDTQQAHPELSVVLLRYFNPIGASPSGLIGEAPQGIPNNLLPYICQVATGQREQLHVFGDDYPTHDGTGIRDYIHVVDLANGHVKAMQTCQAGTHIYNLGTGQGYSVLDLVKTFEAVNGIRIPYVIQDRRPGDIAISYADPSKARRELGWQAQYELKDMLKDAWHWQKLNPNGYEND